MDTVFEMYQFADSIMSDRLKINVIKFISINVVCLFERVFKSQVDQLPQYLWHDIENFIKSENKTKYFWQNFDELNELPSEIENFSGYSALPTKEEWDEIYAGLFELYHSNENVEENNALLQRVKEIKSWWRKLLKKIRHRKNTSTSGRKPSEEEKQLKEDLKEDDIFISDEDIDGMEENLKSSSDEETEDSIGYKYEFYWEFYDAILLFITDYIGSDIFKNFVSKRKQSSENPFVFEVFQNQNKRKESKRNKNRQERMKQRKKKNSEAERKLTDTLLESERKLPKKKTKMTKEQKKEMKKKILDLMPKAPPKPIVI